MVSVPVMERRADGEVDVVAVRDLCVPAAGSVRLAALHRSAHAGAPAVHLQAVLVGVGAVRRVQVPVVQVVGVVAVLHGPVPAAGTVLVPVLVVRLAGHQASPRAILPPES